MFLIRYFRFMDNIHDLLNPDYILTDQEVIQGRIETTSLESLSVNVDGSQFRFLDVGGIRSERRKWDHHYEGVSLIIFVISLPGYYQCLEEDNNTVSLIRAFSHRSTSSHYGSQRLRWENLWRHLNPSREPNIWKTRLSFFFSTKLTCSWTV